MDERLPLRWEDPPRPLTTAEQFAQEWGACAAQLRAHPGEWAVIIEGLAPTKASTMTTKIRRGDVAPWLNDDGNGKYEAQQHTTSNRLSATASRSVTVYARYVLFEND